MAKAGLPMPTTGRDTGSKRAIRVLRGRGGAPGGQKRRSSSEAIEIRQKPFPYSSRYMTMYASKYATSLANLRSRQQRAYKRRRLQKHNAQRHQETTDKRAAQLEVARSLWPQVQQQAQQKQRGRPPYRQVLTDMLKQQGVDASNRDVRYLLRLLNPPETGTTDDGPAGT